MGHTHSHAHGSGDDGHSHAHGDAEGSWGDAVARLMSRATGRFAAATYATGLVHGLQPDALLVLLPALALPRASAVAYLATFLLGTVAAMASYTAFICAGTEQLRVTAPGATRRIALISSFIALAIGAALLGGMLFPQAAEAAGRVFTFAAH